MDNINFNKECSVFIIASLKSNTQVLYKYERPQFISDDILTNEALHIYNDIEQSNSSINELCAVFIARNFQQYKDVIGDKSVCKISDMNN